MDKDIYYNMFEEGGALIRPTEKGFGVFELTDRGREIVANFDVSWAVRVLARLDK